MGRLLGSILIAFLMPLQLIAAEKPGQPEQLEAGMVNPGYHEKPDWFKLSFLDIRDDIDEAADSGKRVLLYFYQDGCPYCEKLLQDNFSDREIAAYSQEKFDVIAINMWGDREVANLDGDTVPEKVFSKSLKVQFTPTLIFLDETGKVLMRINGYFEPYKFLTALKYVGEKKEDQLTIREYYKQLKPEKASGKLHASSTTLQNPKDLSAASEKPLVVMFEQRVCKDCDELHLDILQRSDVKEKLASLDVVVLDMWSNDEIVTPDGQSKKISKWANELGIQYSPSMVFYKSGKEIFRTESYLKSFHTKAAFDYVSTAAYKEYPEFQRYVQKIADDLHAQGIEYDLMD
mgnify:CR=1 FL=1